MPNSVIHMWIAREFAKSYHHLHNDPNYYLGNIAPDAVLGRVGCNNEMKNKSHMLNQRNEWENDVLNYWYEHPRKTPYTIGYVMHILTDIQFRNNCRKFEDDNLIPLEERDKLLSTATAINIRKQFENIEEYYDIVHLAEQYSITEYGLDLTDDDIKQNISFAKKVFNIWSMPEKMDTITYPIIDMTKLSVQTVEYLRKVLQLERSFI